MAVESRLQESVGVFSIPKSVRHVVESGKHGFVQPLGENLARQVYDEAERIIAKDYSAHPWFQQDKCYRKADKDGIHGSSFDLNVVYNSILRQMGLGLPGVVEMKHLDSVRALGSGVYRECGIVQFTGKGVNQDLADVIGAEAKKRGWNLPIVIPSYNPIGHRKGDNGFEVYLLGDKEGVHLDKEVLTGDDAREFLRSNFSFVGDNGVQGLSRDRDGDWDADWCDRYSSGDGRVDFVSGVASAGNLQGIKDKELERNYGLRGQEIDAQMAELQSMKTRLVSQRAEELRAFSEALKS